MPAPNRYRGEVLLPLPSGDVVAVVDTNALRLLMEELGEDDINTTLAAMSRNPLDRIPRMAWHGVRNRKFLEGDETPPPPWETFAAQLGQCDFQAVSEQIATALDLGGMEGKKKDSASA